MPFEKVPGTELAYHLIAFDEQGVERTEPDGTRRTRVVLDALRSEPATDVFVFTHGWMGDMPAARRQCNDWVGAMARCEADVAAMRAARPGFRPLLIGLHWPSLPFGDEDLGPAAVSFAPGAPSPVEEQVEQYAGRIADTPAAREALRTIFEAAMRGDGQGGLTPEVRDAYATLDRESRMGSGGVGAAPGDDREPFDADAVYEAAGEEEAISFGGFSLGGLLAPLRGLSYWKKKDLARRLGESSGAAFLADMQRAAGEARFHLMGHSFGCVVVSSMVAGPGGRGPLVRPIDSLTLAQGALSLWSYCSDIPPSPGRPGYFRGIVADGRVRGPILTTQSTFDRAVGTWYPLASGVARQVTFAAELPKYGGVGSFGLRGPIPKAHDMEMLAADAPYAFEPGAIYNLESSRYINRVADPFVGSHNDIAKPEVAHAVWSAARGAS